MVDSILSSGKNSNCEDDIDEFLLKLGSIQQAADQPHDNNIFLPTISPYESLMSSLPESVRNLLSAVCMPDLLDPPDIELSLQEEHVVTYISGYIARKLRGRACEGCASKLICDEELSVADIQEMKLEFVTKMRYEGAKDGLISPSPELVNVVAQMECVYRKVVDDTIHSDNVKSTLYSKIAEKVDVAGLRCNICKIHASLIHIFINIRFHHTLKETNQNLIQENYRKNRKVLKFQHM